MLLTKKDKKKLNLKACMVKKKKGNMLSMMFFAGKRGYI